MNDQRAEKFKQRLILTAKGKHGARDMSRDEAKEAMEFLLSDMADDIQIAAFLTAMRFKGAREDELAGFMEAIKENSFTINPGIPDILDCSGPYDGRIKSLHLSVPAAIVAVAAGVTIMMHSGGSQPPKYGVNTADVLESLGMPANLTPDEVNIRIDKTGFGFLHLSKFAPGMEKFLGVREKLHYRSFFNTCETLNNPANAKRRILGAAHIPILQKLAKVLKTTGVEHALVVQGIEGSDEIPMEKTCAVEYINGEIKTIEWSPEQFGFKEQKYRVAENASKTASMVFETLGNKLNTCREGVLLNAGVRIYMGNRADTIAKGIEQAREVLESGKALRKLEEIIKV